MRAKRDLLAQAPVGQLEAHHHFLIQEHLSLIEQFDEHADAEIAEQLKSYEEVIKRLDTVPGVDHRSSEVFFAEIGMDIHRFRKSPSPSTALLFSLKQISLRHGDRLIALALIVKKLFHQLALHADRIQTNKAVLGSELISLL
jgi:transposase